jgi:hypothetical protein
MRRIAESGNEFLSRYNLVPVFREAVLFNCSLKYIVPLQSIEVLLKPDATMGMSAVLSQVDALLLSLGANAQQKRQLRDSVACVYCAEGRSSNFSICGHHCCRACLSVAVQQFPPLLPRGQLRNLDRCARHK